MYDPLTAFIIRNDEREDVNIYATAKTKQKKTFMYDYFKLWNCLDSDNFATKKEVEVTGNSLQSLSLFANCAIQIWVAWKQRA